MSQLTFCSHFHPQQHRSLKMYNNKPLSLSPQVSYCFTFFKWHSFISSQINIWISDNSVELICLFQELELPHYARSLTLYQSAKISHDESGLVLIIVPSKCPPPPLSSTISVLIWKPSEISKGEITKRNFSKKLNFIAVIVVF